MKDQLSKIRWSAVPRSDIIAAVSLVVDVHLLKRTFTIITLTWIGSTLLATYALQTTALATYAIGAAIALTAPMYLGLLVRRHERARDQALANLARDYPTTDT